MSAACEPLIRLAFIVAKGTLLSVRVKSPPSASILTSPATFNVKSPLDNAISVPSILKLYSLLRKFKI